MAEQNDVKSFLYAWLGKKKCTPEYNIRPAGAKHRQRFLCELRGILQIRFSNSRKKHIFLNFHFHEFFPSSSWLWLQCVWKFNEQKRFPSQCCQRLYSISFTTRADATQWSTRWMWYGSRRRSCHWTSSYGRTWIESKTCFSAWVSFWQFLHFRFRNFPKYFPNFLRYGPQDLGEAYQPVGRQGGQGVNFRQQYLETMDKKKMEEAEDVDVNAGIHGNWTMENAKSMLHQWMQTNRIKADYQYSSAGQDHNRSFVAEMRFYVNKLGKWLLLFSENMSNQSTWVKLSFWHFFNILNFRVSGMPVYMIC